MDHGLREVSVDDFPLPEEFRDAKWTLKCSKEFEARIYRTLPDMWEYLPNIACPYSIWKGENR